MNPKQIQQMMKQAQKMQDDLKSAQAELEKKEYTVTTGGGAVTIVMSGAKKIISLDIKAEVIDPDDKDMLEEMITLAFNNVITEIDKEAESQMSSLTGGLPF